MHCYTQQQSDAYLRRHFGALNVRFEGKNANRESELDGEGFGHATLAEFLDRDAKGDDVYVVSQLPTPMQRDVRLAGAFRCGPQDSVIEADLYLSSGGTASNFHRDPQNFFHCVLAGEKDWFLAPMAEGKHLYLADDMDEGTASVLADSSGDSEVDTLRVDLQRFPDVAKLAYSKATLRAGDCVYVPGSMHHHVRARAGKGGRSIAFSVLLSGPTEMADSHAQFDVPFRGKSVWSACTDVPSSAGGKTGAATVFPHIPLSEVDVAYNYPGTGKMSMNFDDPDWIQLELSRFFPTCEGCLQTRPGFDKAIRKWTRNRIRYALRDAEGPKAALRKTEREWTAKLTRVAAKQALKFFDTLEAENKQHGTGVTAQQWLGVPRPRLLRNLAVIFHIDYITMHPMIDEVEVDEPSDAHAHTLLQKLNRRHDREMAAVFSEITAFGKGGQTLQKVGAAALLVGVLFVGFRLCGGGGKGGGGSRQLGRRFDSFADTAPRGSWQPKTPSRWGAKAAYD